jgi:hypothetical protein
MLEDLYTQIAIYREVAQTDDWGNTDDQDNWQFDHYEQGFFQPRSGSYIQANQRNNPLSTHVLYCGVSTDIVEGDRIKYNAKYYRVDFIQQTIGIGGIADHQELDLSYLDDLS